MATEVFKPDTQGLDFSTIFEVLKLSKGENLSSILKNPLFLTMIIQLVSGLLEKKKEVVITPPTPPTPVEPPDEKEEEPPTPPPAKKRQVSRLKGGLFFIEEANPNRRRILPKKEFDEIVHGGAPVNSGYRVHMNLTPVDQNGKNFEKGDPENESLFSQDPSLGAVEGNNRIEHHLVIGDEDLVSGDLNPGQTWDAQDYVFLTSEYDDFGMTPVLTINRDLPVDTEAAFQYYGVLVTPDGKRFTSPRTPVIHIHTWQR